jgi:hypothetical protein
MKLIKKTKKMRKTTLDQKKMNLHHVVKWDLIIKVLLEKPLELIVQIDVLKKKQEMSLVI